MNDLTSQEAIRRMVQRWLPSYPVPAHRLHIHTDTSDFYNVDYNDVVILGQRPYLIRHNAKEGRFGLEDEVKFWVKSAVDLSNGHRKIIKLVFYERFMSHIGDIEFECFRSPKKEARILELVAGHKNFMHGHAIKDEKDNIIRILDFISGKTLAHHIGSIAMDHETYFYQQFPDIFNRFIECVEAIRFLHEHGERHGDIRRDHILIDRQTATYRWIDFDFNYRHRENIYGYDLFGLGNVLVYLAGKGDVLIPDLRGNAHPWLDIIDESDLNIVFRNRVVNLRKLYPYIPESLNRILLHFSRGSNRFYDHARQILCDLEQVRWDS
ncbi:hypothetical protein HNR65_002572 [Desulfosalsimonas propionicica]|uniref:Protein kinase domain-containing protein n=1 Tax=Desulfosalsimonas propionicica TaxID=332175 RepID=A0A7W0HLE6_9BACT|nr:hypothetical protein [Desulfosalsimonas propionicica]MBA2882230.1 hypothetical protein [Desulfosalsimonas propionicica]